MTMGPYGDIFQRVHSLMDECEQLVESGRKQVERARVIVDRSRKQERHGADGREPISPADAEDPPGP